MGRGLVKTLFPAGPRAPTYAPAYHMRTLDELLVATHNAGKLGEFGQLLRGLPLKLRGLKEFPDAVAVEETGQTFAENAALKARHYSRLTNLWTLADDSGLEVDALGGRPGVRSARYAGPDATDAERTSRIVEELAATGDGERRARFVCVVALYQPAAEELRLFSGKCEGRIASGPRGEGGFGYDPVFIPDGFDKTFGELPSEVKNRVSHRARALEGLKSYLLQIFSGRLDPPGEAPIE